MGLSGATTTSFAHIPSELRTLTKYLSLASVLNTQTTPTPNGGWTRDCGATYYIAWASAYALSTLVVSLLYLGKKKPST